MGGGLTPSDPSGSSQVPPFGGNWVDPGNGGQGDYSPPEPDTGLSPEIEADIHVHLVDCYSNLEPYYNQVCAGFNNLYATMNDHSLTHVSRAPTNAALLLNTCDQGRIRTDSYRYDGEDVMGESIWCEESRKIANCFNDLTNACSVMREVNGFTVGNAPGILGRYLNSDGEVRPLAEFRVRYASIRL